MPYFYEMNELLLPYQRLWQFAHDIFLKIGCPNDQARQAADVLLSADREGVVHSFCKNKA